MFKSSQNRTYLHQQTMPIVLLLKSMTLKLSKVVFTVVSTVNVAPKCF